jgi:DinB superfamily
MGDINTALRASREAVDHMIELADKAAAGWATSRAPGKWSPSQIVEHVALSLEESAKVATGRPSRFPKLPAVIHPVMRGLFFRRVLRKSAFPNAKTNKAMNPSAGPATPAAGKLRLETAHAEFEGACRQLASRGEHIRTTTFGSVRVEDYVRFMELHTRHHGKQISALL